MSIVAVLVILVLLLTLLPREGAYNANWGLFPLGGGLGLVLVLIILLALIGYF